MCGIAGFSLSPTDLERVSPRTLTKRLALSIENRGGDATGFAYYNPGMSQTEPYAYFKKAPETASEFVDRHRHSSIPRDAGTMLIHTRAATQGDRSLNDNNHPIIVDRRDHKPAIIGVHNGMLSNDWSIWNQYPRLKEERKGTVDSQLLFQIISRMGEDHLELIKGDASIAWFEDMSGLPELHLAKMGGRPLAFAYTDGGSMLFASTSDSLLDTLAYFKQLKIKKIHDVRDGEAGVFVDGEMVDHTIKFPVINLYRASYSSKGATTTTYPAGKTSTTKVTPPPGKPITPAGKVISKPPTSGTAKVATSTSETLDAPDAWNEKTPPSPGGALALARVLNPQFGHDEGPEWEDPYTGVRDDSDREADAVPFDQWARDEEFFDDSSIFSPDGELRLWEKRLWFLYFSGTFDEEPSDQMIRDCLELLYRHEQPEQLDSMIDLVQNGNLIAADIIRGHSEHSANAQNKLWAIEQKIIPSNIEDTDEGVPDWTPGVNHHA